MKINNYNEWQKARFDECVLKILLNINELTDQGESRNIHASLLKALNAYIESRPNIPMITLNKDTDEREIDETYYWITYTMEMLLELSANISLLFCLKDYKVGRNESLNNIWEKESEMLRNSIEEYSSNPQ